MPTRKSLHRRRRTKRHRRFARKRLSGGANATYIHTTIHPPTEINDLITHVIYINLDKRTDRRAEMEAELSIFTPEKVTRLPGILGEKEGIAPAVACTKGHIEALKLARKNNYSNVLILEDDVVWVNTDESFPIFKGILQNTYDGIMLGATFVDYDKNTYLLKQGYTASSYLVHQNHYDKMIDYLEKRINEYDPAVVKTKNEAQAFAPNVIMVANRTDDKWFIVSPSLMVQRPSFSNVAKIEVNYRSVFV